MHPNATPQESPARRAPRRLGHAIALLALAAWALPATAACPSMCLTMDGVKNAAGVDPKLFNRISFSRGNASVTASTAVISQIARDWRTAGGSGVLKLATLGDAGTSAAAAHRLAAARATALSAALVAAGIPADKVQIEAHR